MTSVQRRKNVILKFKVLIFTLQIILVKVGEIVRENSEVDSAKKFSFSRQQKADGILEKREEMVRDKKPINLY